MLKFPFDVGRENKKTCFFSDKSKLPGFKSLLISGDESNSTQKNTPWFSDSKKQHPESLMPPFALNSLVLVPGSPYNTTCLSSTYIPESQANNFKITYPEIVDEIKCLLKQWPFPPKTIYLMVFGLQGYITG